MTTSKTKTVKLNQSLQWIRVEEVTRFKSHPKSWLHMAVNSIHTAWQLEGTNL